MDIYLWAFAILAGIPLWWFAFYATKRMRIGKNLEREAQAKRNLERFAREQSEQTEQAAKEQAAAQENVEPQKNGTSATDTVAKEEKS